MDQELGALFRFAAVCVFGAEVRYTPWYEAHECFFEHGEREDGLDEQERAAEDADVVSKERAE